MIGEQDGLAWVDHRLGRYVLMIGDLVLAMETDPCRDPELEGKFWGRANLLEAARRINEAAKEQLK